MNTHPTHITINNHTHRVSNILNSRVEHSEKIWQTQWMNFLAEWYNNNSYIEVKTSGSTGTPKSIHLEKSFVAASAQRTLNFFQLKAGDKILHCLPSNFIAGKLMLVRALIGELNVHIVDPSTSFHFLAHENYTFAALVVNQMHKILEQYPEIPIEKILLGGSAIPSSLEPKLQAINSLCYSSYAMTETATHIALRQINHSPVDNYYHCLNNIHVQLNENGCLQIHMPGLAHESINTNDIATLINKKTFLIRGRIDNCIISGGKKFFAEEIEQQLAPHIPFEFMISSQAHDSLGEEIILFLEAPYSIALEQKIKAICAQVLSKHEQARAFFFVEKLERTENGKIKRK